MDDNTDRIFRETAPLTADEEQAHELFGRLAEWVVKRRMAAPAILFLESHRPLSFVGSQAMIFASPLVSFFEPFFKGFLGKGFSYDDYRRFAELMENRDNVELLVIEVERKSQEARVAEKEEKARLKALKREAKEKRKALRQARKSGLSG